MSSPLILTATDRLARSLREDLNLAERAAGHSVWQTPNVRSLRQWIAEVWADSWPTEQLLSATQMQALWLDAVERDRRGVISASACAREAREADRIAQEYGLALDQAPAYSEEQRAWQSWHRRIAGRMREQRWLSPDALPMLVAKGLREGRLQPPPQVELADTDLATPAERAVLEALADVTRVTEHLAPLSTASVHGFRCADESAQLRFVAETIRRRLAPHADGATSAPRIIVALPDPDARRSTLEDALIEHVAPLLRQYSQDDTAAVHAPWRWDAAPALTESPWAAGLNALVAIDAIGNSPERISQLLLGTWFADAERHAAAAAVDLALRKSGALRIDVARLAALAQMPLRECLASLAHVVESAPRRALPSAWSSHFTARCEAAGWPAVNAPPSGVFQIVQELRRAISALATLDAQTGPIDIGRARLWLNELLKRRFEPRADHAQPVLLLAAEDAIGMACDLLIVVDADSGNFPGIARTTPFLPIELQRLAGVPQASPGAWLAHRRRQISALIAQAKEVIVIAPRHDARGGELLASPLFDVHWQDAPTRSIASLAETLAMHGPHARMPLEDPVPPVNADEKITGTTRLFELYAQAPFFAFCNVRLGIETLPEVGHGLPASLQGMLVHQALADFWRGVDTRSALRALGDSDRTARIHATLAPLIAKHLPDRDYGRVLVTLEAARLADVLDGWLRLEAARADDFQVIDHERKLNAVLADLPLSLRLDRIERSLEEKDSATLTLIDYKTGGAIDANGWREDRLLAPQLPLYTVLFDDAGGAIDDIGFAHVADGAPELLRWSSWSSRAKMRNAPVHAGDFAAQRRAWRMALEEMAAGFLGGRAGIDPEQAIKMRDAPLLVLAGLNGGDEDAIAAGDAGIA